MLATAVALCSARRPPSACTASASSAARPISLLLVLPLALPGIITGIALNSAFQYAGHQPLPLTIVIGHATFCIVVVYNNVIARLRRVSGSLYEAAADLGAHGFLIFRTITLPMLSTALVSGALLAFALSFDEVIVTTSPPARRTRCRCGSSARSASASSCPRSTSSSSRCCC